MIVPPGGVVVFRVAASLNFNLNSGQIEFDFTSGDFEAICPAVLGTVRG